MYIIQWQRCTMNTQDMQTEIENLTTRLETMGNELVGRSATTLEMVKPTINSQAKPDIFSDGSWEEWVAHFKLCAGVDKWDDEQSCQQFVVSLRGRAQSIYLTLNDEDKVDFKRLTEAMEKKMKPEQERLVNKLAFCQ